jgi:hypothetical protein
MKIQILIVLPLLIFSCKSNTNGPGTVGDDYTPIETFVLLNQNGILDVEVEIMRDEAIKILEHRQKETDSTAISLIERDIYIFDGVLISSNMIKGDSLAGEWLDFKKDLTYDYGKFDKVNGSGRYFFDSNGNTLLLINDNPAIKPHEYETKRVSDVLILIGKQIYRDNNIQTKLSRVATKPVAQTGTNN